MSKKVKIALYIFGALLLGGVVYYFFFSKSSKAEKPFAALADGPAYNEFCVAVKAALGETDLYAFKYHGRMAEELAIGYFKSKNYAATANNVKLYSAEMVAYIKDPSSKAHWQIA